MAVDQIDKELSPELVGRIKEADKNYAIASDVSKQEKGIANAIEEAGNAGTGGNVGNKIRQAVEKDLKKARDKGYLTPEVQTAMEGVTKPGWAVNALRPISAFDPTHSKLGMFGAGAVAREAMGNPLLASLPIAGYAARAAYDRIMTQRAAKISDAMRAQSPAAMARPGAPGGIFAGRQAPDLAQIGILNLGIKPGNTGY
jgi:hypothetical protein